MNNDSHLGLTHSALFQSCSQLTKIKRKNYQHFETYVTFHACQCYPGWKILGTNSRHVSRNFYYSSCNSPSRDKNFYKNKTLHILKSVENFSLSKTCNKFLSLDHVSLSASANRHSSLSVTNRSWLKPYLPFFPLTLFCTAGWLMKGKMMHLSRNKTLKDK